MKKFRVYFHQRPHHRRRQQETVENPPPGITALQPEGLDFIEDTSAMIRGGSFLYGMKSRLLKTLLPLNLRIIRDSKATNADLIYTWGVIPIGISKFHVIDIETPYVFTLFNLRAFRILRPFLRWVLMRHSCRAIICLSKACKRSLTTELSKTVSGKAFVVYPYISDHTKCKKSQPASRKVNFLFVSTRFYDKGGREVMLAFEKLARKEERFHLTMVSNVPEQYRERFGNRPWITMVGANLSKGKLMDEYFARTDVFVLPTYEDCFGMVVLEALSFGLPIITTPVYAIPEMVEHGRNGFIIEAPFYGYAKDGRARFLTSKALTERIVNNSFPDVEKQINACAFKLLSHRTRSQMSKEARKIFAARFHPDVRNERLASLLSAACSRG